MNVGVLGGMVEVEGDTRGPDSLQADVAERDENIDSHACRNLNMPSRDAAKSSVLSMPPLVKPSPNMSCVSSKCSA